MVDILHARARGGIYGYDKRDLKWISTDKKGMQLAPVRADREEGQYLGYLKFDSMAETGLHQHLGPAFSYFLDGGLADFQGVARAGEVGINLAGATHSAIAYAPTLMASRLEAPVIYPSQDSVAGETLHTGATAGEIVNETPEVLPDINIFLEDLSWQGTLHAGVQRRMIFDYTQTEHSRRHLQLRLLPYTSLPPFRAGGATDIFIIGGDLEVGDETRMAGDFFVMEEGAVVELGTRFGALVLVWAEGPSNWHHETGPDLWGF
ncbi:hypothetical protein [Aestuariivita sp.]|uniref:cupin domain-containing protein n=1 Tax=Aestuariivita sp. TaxID=1872407 RepID=UPI002173FA27|nr:hypothetical protein [Aestuariivita sp.]MCE8009642.1 hypothetical protein [Aestuariivita sp.]